MAPVIAAVMLRFRLIERLDQLCNYFVRLFPFPFCHYYNSKPSYSSESERELNPYYRYSVLRGNAHPHNSSTPRPAQKIDKCILQYHPSLCIHHYQPQQNP